MGRLSMDENEREARLRELEAELDDELGLASTAGVETTPKKPRRETTLDYGKAALYSLGIALATMIGMKLGGLVIGLSLLAAVGFGIMWLVKQVRGGGDTA
ncbi:MAG: hypothetical protein HUU35_09465 [Armatimonadetes bacterium]|nr:hypothetical protein [Armatimonadota bacterium]